MIDIPAIVERLRRRALEEPWVDCNPDLDIAWAENLKPPSNAADFALEIIFVICNSGMRFTVARGIYDRVHEELLARNTATTAFGHPGKVKAIDFIWKERIRLYDNYMSTDDKLGYIAALPWIGEITKYHVAKNFGLPYAKPDVHLQRLADTFRTTPQQLCEDLAKASGYSVATIDTLLWRAAAVGILDTRSGAVT